MLLKVLREPEPCTGQGRPYSDEQRQFFWDTAQALAEGLEAGPAADLRARRPGPALAQAVRELAGRRPMFTLTGRLRADTTFCSARNGVFQGLAADGAIYALWSLWRSGERLVSFVHDQVVVEAPVDGSLPERVARVERLMREGMARVLPGMEIRVESVVTRSLNCTEYK